MTLIILWIKHTKLVVECDWIYEHILCFDYELLTENFIYDYDLSYYRLSSMPK